MNKQELRQKFSIYERLMAHRLRCEKAIIEALPSKLDVVRVVAPKRIEQPETGGVEIEVESYGDALTLAFVADRFNNFKPVALTQVVAERVPGQKTTSFIPSCRVPVRWHNDPQTSHLGEVYPVLFQILPGDDPLIPRVSLEWYAELAPEIVVSVRAIIKHHPVMWVRRSGIYRTHGPSLWTWPGAPDADCKRVLQMKQGQPPYVTLWWRKGFDYFILAVLGGGKEGQRDEA